jgi:hypothetical protein
MRSNKQASGIYSVDCREFPKFSTKKELLKDKRCFIIESYHDKDLISIYILRDTDEFIIKILDKDGKCIDPNGAGPIGNVLLAALQVNLYTRVEKSQLFFAVSGDEFILVDVFNGSDFISAGMIKDLYGKRIKTQKIISTEDYDPNKKYGATIKPVTMCYEQNNPVYLLQ